MCPSLVLESGFCAASCWAASLPLAGPGPAPALNPSPHAYQQVTTEYRLQFIVTAARSPGSGHCPKGMCLLDVTANTSASNTQVSVPMMKTPTVTKEPLAPDHQSQLSQVRHNLPSRDPRMQHSIPRAKSPGPGSQIQSQSTSLQRFSSLRTYGRRLGASHHAMHFVGGTAEALVFKSILGAGNKSPEDQAVPENVSCRKSIRSTAYHGVVIGRVSCCIGL